jgi:hypothetical protein
VLSCGSCWVYGTRAVLCYNNAASAPEATLRSAGDLCSSWARLQVVAVGTTTGKPTPNVLAALAITDGREPHASDLGLREAAADSPVLPLAPIACDGVP